MAGMLSTSHDLTRAVCDSAGAVVHGHQMEQEVQDGNELTRSTVHRATPVQRTMFLFHSRTLVDLFDLQSAHRDSSLCQSACGETELARAETQQL